MSDQGTHESFRERDAIKGSSNRSFGIVFAVVFAIIGLFSLIGGVRIYPAERTKYSLCFCQAALFSLSRKGGTVFLKLGRLLTACHQRPIFSRPSKNSSPSSVLPR